MLFFIQSSSTQRIESTYHKKILVTYYFDKDKNLVVIINATTNKFITGWTLVKLQRDDLFKNNHIKEYNVT
jgi:hypothetical protein